MNKIGKTILEYLPAIITAFLAVITLILYVTVIETHKASAYFAVSVIPLVPFAIIFANRKWKLGLPLYLVISICLHFVLAVDLGTAMGFYTRFDWWDLFVHGFFGFLGCAILYYLYLRLEKKEPNVVNLVMIVLLTVAFAALWEIYEFIADLLLHTDMQGVEEALERNISPLTDTMTDIMIAIAGAVIFYVFLFVRKKFFVKSAIEDKDE